jgi:hypothetical protein
VLNDYHRKRNEAAIKAVEEMAKHPVSAEQMKEQIQRSLSEPDDESKLTSEEEKRRIFEASPKRKELLLSLDERDKQTIVEALEITIINRLTSDELSGVPDFGIKRFISWRHLAMNMDVQITMTPRNPIINFIRQNLIQPLMQEIQESNLDSDSIEVMNEKIQYYTNLIGRLKFIKEKS